MPKDKVIAVVLGLFFVALIWAQFFFTSDIRHDHQVTRDLQTIENQIRERAYQGDRFNTSRSEFDYPELSEMNFDTGLTQKIERGDYELRYIEDTTDSITFELCADFKTDTATESYTRDSYRYHEVGRNCFERTIY